MKIECHVLQNFAPSCLNRDDTNTPKDCEFGGSRRARVSSQSWKRAVREFFRAENSVPVGTRTKHLKEQLTARLIGEATSAEVGFFVEAAYSKMDGKRPDETAVLVFISEAEIEAAAACIRQEQSKLKKDYKPDKSVIEALKAAQPSADIALFGRMLAEQPGRNTNAACQVAHAFSTHAVDLEMDFYTAVDDLTKDRDETGAGMLGTQGFNSACFYRYALLDTAVLQKNLGDDPTAAYAAVEAFLNAFCLSIPTAKQNSHAAQNLPSFGMFVVRETGVPVSLANAFAQPIRRDDIITESIGKLAHYYERLNTVYDLYAGATVALFHDGETDKPLGELLSPHDAGSMANAVEAVMARIKA
ncbi:MAG: type I-E CRISPR-associated protein Cas7/Cse4/CasC [Janthinobacterium lividum]